MPTALVATDGSRLAHEAIGRGLAIVDPAATVVLVAVVPAADPSLVVGTGHSGPVMDVDEKQQLLDAQQSEGAAWLTEAAALVPGDPETHLLRGDAGRQICALATEIGADVVVMGTRGRSGLRRAVLGSVSDHVVRNAPCPVLTVTSD